MPVESLRIGDSPSKGKGLFANTKFSAGTRIFAEDPVFSVDNATPVTVYSAVFSADPRARTRYKFLPHAGHLPVTEKEVRALGLLQFLPLDGDMTRLRLYEQSFIASNPEWSHWKADVKHHEQMFPSVETQEAAKFFAIFMDTSFSMWNDQNVDRCGYFEMGARLNHSCTPNCQAFWSAQSVLSLHAIRHIDKDEELSIAYDDLVLTDKREGRMQRLRERFRFECACSACDISTAAGRVNEVRRTALAKVAELIERNSTPTGVGVLSVALWYNQMLNLMQSQGLKSRKKGDL